MDRNYDENLTITNVDAYNTGEAADGSYHEYPLERKDRLDFNAHVKQIRDEYNAENKGRGKVW